ncbi:MAG TPA: hypothetical protein VNO14_18935, partial [Blastocatellia bacterium]|nr:hypothetical protein [Blastocatellia bacterium]
FPELIVFTVGLSLIYYKRDLLLALLIFIGTLNRETTAFLPLILLLNRFDRKAIWKCIPTVALAGFAWLIPLLLLRYWKGIGVMGIYGDSVVHNVAGLKAFFSNFNLFNNYLFYLYLFGPFWLLPLIKWKNQPLFFQRTLLSLPAFIIIYLFFGGFLDEPREIINLYPILIPSSLFALFGTEHQKINVAAANGQ